MKAERLQERSFEYCPNRSDGYQDFKDLGQKLIELFHQFGELFYFLFHFITSPCDYITPHYNVVVNSFFEKILKFYKFVPFFSKGGFFCPKHCTLLHNFCVILTIEGV